MKDKTYVCCHSPAISMLVYETASSSTDHMGFLLGSVRKLTVTSTTDENEAADEEKTIIYVEHCLPLSSESFNSLGEGDHALLYSQCQSVINSIIGCYTFRRNQARLRCSLKENLIHRWCTEKLPLPSDSSKTFIMGLLSSTIKANQGTHSFRHLFLQRNRKLQLEPIRFKVYSLSDTLSNSSGYVKNVALPGSDVFQKAIASSANMTSQSDAISKIHVTVTSSLIDIGKKVSEVEAEEYRLLKEIQALKKSLNLIPLDPEVTLFISPTQNFVTAPLTLKFNSQEDYAAGRILPLLHKETDGFDEDCEMTYTPSEDGDASEIHSSPPGFQPLFPSSPSTVRETIPSVDSHRFIARGRGISSNPANKPANHQARLLLHGLSGNTGEPPNSDNIKACYIAGAGRGSTYCNTSPNDSKPGSPQQSYSQAAGNFQYNACENDRLAENPAVTSELPQESHDVIMLDSSEELKSQPSSSPDIFEDAVTSPEKAATNVQNGPSTLGWNGPNKTTVGWNNSEAIGTHTSSKSPKADSNANVNQFACEQRPPLGKKKNRNKRS